MGTYTDDYPFDCLLAAIHAAVAHDYMYCRCVECHEKRAAHIEALCQQFYAEEDAKPRKPKKHDAVKAWLGPDDTHAGPDTQISRKRAGGSSESGA